MNFYDNGIEVLRREFQSFKVLIDSLEREKFDKVCETIINTKGHIITTGIGKSGFIAAKFASTLASTGTPAFFVHPAEASHGDLGMITIHNTVIVFSNSGETREIIDILEYCKKNDIKIIGITSKENSTLGKYSDVCLLYPVEKEACFLNLAPTTSTTLQLALSDAIAVAVYLNKDFKEKDFKSFHPGGKLGKKLMLVRDIMTNFDYIVTAFENEKVKDVILKMSSGKKGGLAFIVDENKVLKGILTDGDFRRNSIENVLDKEIGSIMNRKPITVKEDVLAYECLTTMKKNRIMALPVVDCNGCLLGMIHIHDLLKMGL